MVLHMQLITIILKYDCFSTRHCSSGSLFITVPVSTAF